MEPPLTVLMILGNLFVLLLIADRAQMLWKNRSSRPGAVEADHVELKAYTHESVHEIRDKLHGLQLSVGVLTERIAGLEAKVGSQAATQVEALDRMLKLIESQLFKPQDTKPA